MDKQLEQDLINRLVPFLYDMGRKLEAEWATCFYFDEKTSTIQVYGKPTHKQQEYPTQLTRLPLASFKRFMGLNKTQKLESLSAPPVLCREEDPAKNPPASTLQEPLPVPSPAVGEVDLPSSPAASPVTKTSVTQRADPSA